jgi:hypothetical protein
MLWKNTLDPDEEHVGDVKLLSARPLLNRGDSHDALPLIYSGASRYERHDLEATEDVSRCDSRTPTYIMSDLMSQYEFCRCVVHQRTGNSNISVTGRAESMSLGHIERRAGKISESIRKVQVAAGVVSHCR